MAISLPSVVSSSMYLVDVLDLTTTIVGSFTFVLHMVGPKSDAACTERFVPEVR